MRKIKIKKEYQNVKIFFNITYCLKNKIGILFFMFIWSALYMALPCLGFCDTLRLKEIPKDKEGNEVEILEERDDSFIIKVPKYEIEVVKRKRPTEIKLWKEKRILWEDTGDYITIYLPKENIVLPEKYTGEEYDSAKVLKGKLEGTAVEGRPHEATFWEGTGKITGRILKGKQSLSKVKVRIVNVSSQTNTLAQFFGPKDKKPENMSFETVTDELGYYTFNKIPLGEYDIYWCVSGTDNWYRRLSEKPDIAVRPGEAINNPDIELN